MERREVIVCIDDEEGVLRVLRAQLGARFGHECQIATARSGDEAVALFDELAREGEAVALVVADQIMPGMKGVELLEIVDHRMPATTKILLTGQAGLDAVIEGINRAHLNLYISKPWDETALLLGVENLLRQFRLVHENQQLIASLSAKNQALLEMNRELEAKIHERTHELAEANSTGTSTSGWRSRSSVASAADCRCRCSCSTSTTSSSSTTRSATRRATRCCGSSPACSPMRVAPTTWSRATAARSSR